MLSDLATSDPAFESSLSAEGCNGRVGILAEALLTTALQVSAREAVARLLRVSIFPRILGMSRGQDAWDMEMRELCLFKKVHGHVLVPQRCTRAGCKLGLWVKWVRGAYKRGVLSNIQVELLHGLGFVWDVPAHLWETGRTKLEKYSHDHRHVLVPHNYETPDGFKLGVWVSQKRTAKSKGKLGQEQIKSLDNLGFVWDVPDHLWKQGINRLQEYKTKHGHVLVPSDYVTPDGFKLGLWVNHRRVAKSRGHILEKHRKSLDDLGFVWHVLGHWWEQSISRLKDYKKKHGHVLVPHDYVTPDRFKLGIWVSQNRMAKSKGKLGQEQIRVLDDLGFVWDVLDHRWERWIRRLQEYRTKHGHVLVPRNCVTPDGFKLGSWVNQKRVAQAKGKLGQEQIKSLDNLGFVWDVPDHLWKQGINRFQEYKTKHGHVLVPSDYVTPDGFKLGLWVNHRRVAKSKGKLGREQIKSLDDLGFVWDVLGHWWEQSISRLKDYKRKHGHVLVPHDYDSDGFKLGIWVSKKRMAKSKGKLGQEQIRSLDELGFVWDVLDHLWEQGINRLQDYRRQHGHVLVPKGYETADGFKLGNWVNQRRVAKSRGKLGKEHIQCLDNVGFIWNVYGHMWEQGTERLQDYKKEHQNAVVPRDYEASDGFKLGGWVARQRAAHSRGILTKEQIQRLEDLGLKWGSSRPHLLEKGVEGEV